MTRESPSNTQPSTESGSNNAITKNNSQKKKKFEADLSKKRGGSNKKSRTNRRSTAAEFEVLEEKLNSLPQEDNTQEERHAPSLVSTAVDGEIKPTTSDTFSKPTLETQLITMSEVQHIDKNIYEKMPATRFTFQKSPWISHEVESNFVVAPVMVTVPGDLAGLFAAGAAGDLAITAVVGGAFALGGPGALAIGAAIAPLAAAIAQLSAQLSNQRICKRNTAAFDGVSNGSLLHVLAPLFVLQKEVAGAGPALPGAAPGPLPAGHPFAVGAIIPAPFPASVHAFNNLTNANICELAIMYNDTFGIVPADLREVRLQKLQLFLCGR